MTRTHEIKLDGYGAHTTLAEDRPIMLLGTAESYGIEMLHVVSGKSWEGLTITATFNAPDGTSTDMLMSADGSITVPSEATAKSGSGKIVFTGVADGVQRISCDLDYFVVAHSAINGVQSGGVAPSWFEQAVTRFMPPGGTAGQVLTKLTNTDFDAGWQDSEGGGGTTDHSKLGNRDAADQHPISAITGLEEALTPLTGTTETLTPMQVYDAIKSGKSVLLQHTIPPFGLFTFASFNIFEGRKAVVSTSIAKNGNEYLVGSLVGSVGRNEWVFNVTEMAEADDIPFAVNEALAQAKASGEFDGADGLTPTIGDNGNWYLGETDTGKPSRGDKGDKGDKGDTGETGATGAVGADGKSAYAYAQDGGYVGTEEQFAAKLAKEKFANPNALTFTGAVNETYDGSSAKTIEIPSGGGGGGTNLSPVYENTFENIAGINETIDALNGKENFVFNIEFTPPADGTTGVIIHNIFLYNGERRFRILYSWKSAPYSAAYPKKAIYGSVLKLGEGLWERIVLKSDGTALLGDGINSVPGKDTSFQYLKDNQWTQTAAGLSVVFDQTVESVKVQIYAG